MSKYIVEAASVISAPAEVLHAIITDYRGGHKAILPKPYFTDMTVEKGGFGAGTVLHVYMEAFGKKYHYHQLVTEPEPGRRVVETTVDTNLATTFTFEPLNGGAQTRVTIATEFLSKPGIAGFFERLMTQTFARRLYKQELQNLADYARNNQVAVRPA